MNGIFSSAGFRAYLVGGAVRDIFLGKEASDWDVATDAEPGQVAELFRSVIPTGIAHGTVTVIFMGRQIEVTTFRSESGYADGRHPDSVRYAATIEDDLSRRDFTMNAIAADLSDGSITDPFDGRGDIRRKIIRTVGSPSVRFLEDGLRPVRAVRFSAVLGFTIGEATSAAISQPDVLRKVAGISVERFRDELAKLLSAPKPSSGLRMLERTGIMGIFMPEFLPCRGCVQRDFRGYHEFDVMDHLFYSCDGAPVQEPLVRLAALYHDIGKPSVKEIRLDPEGRACNTFHGHETAGAVIAEKSLASLRFPNSVVSSVSHLVRQHMFNYEPSWSDAAVRRFIVRVRPEFIGMLFDLRLADIYGMHNSAVRTHDTAAGSLLVEFRDRIASEMERKPAVTLRDLAVNGKDLMNAGIKPGREMGRILNSLLDMVIEDPMMNSRERLLAAAAELG